MSKTILVIGAGPWQVPMILKAKELGLTVIATDREPSAPGLKLADIPHVTDTADTEKNLEIAERFAVSGVATMGSDIAGPTAAFVAERMGFPGLPYEKSLVCRNKYLVRETLAGCGLETVKYARLTLGEDPRTALARFDLPAVIKPSDSWGGMGTSLVSGMGELENALKEALSYSRKGEVIIEEYLEGPEVSIEGLCYGGESHIVGITDKIVTPPPYFVETGHTLPSSLPAEAAKELAVYAKDVLEALEISNCAFHIEAKYSGGKPKLVEFGARLGGGAITSDLVPLSTGVDLVRAVLSMALGQKPDLTPKKASAAAVRFFQPPPGMVTDVDGVEEAAGLDGVRAVRLDLHKGDNVRPFRNNSDRVGYVVAEGETPEESAALAERAVCTVSIKVER